jgi:hypothetical protein
MHRTAQNINLTTLGGNGSLNAEHGMGMSNILRRSHGSGVPNVDGSRVQPSRCGHVTLGSTT